MKRWILPFGFLVVALGAAFYYQQLQANARTGFPAPEFALKDLHDHTHHLSDFRGKIVFLNVWATWCPPCRMEMPSMENLYRRLRGKGLVMLAVSEDEAGPAAVQPFVEEMGLTFPVLLDESGALPPRYGVTGYPETFIIDREGRVMHHTIGPEDWDSTQAIAFFDRLLDQGTATAGSSQAPADS
jgi:peroxiredoxin